MLPKVAPETAVVPLVDNRTREKALIRQPERPSANAPFSARVAGVRTGCVIEVKKENRFEKVRLDGVICLDPRSIAGKTARQYTTRTAFIQQVTVTAWRKDALGEMVGDVILPDGRLLNRNLVLLGLANADGLRFQDDEQESRDRRAGLWKNPGHWINAPNRRRNPRNGY